MKKIAFHTLGCKLNFAETSTIARQFTEHGYQKVNFNEKADIYVINTCSVTQKADKKSEQAVKKARNLNPDSKIIVVGCYAQLQPETLASIKGVDLILGHREKFRAFDYIEKTISKKESPEIHTCKLNEINNYHHAYSQGDRTRSFLKVQDGCDYFCTYCTIPFARGRSRNQEIKEIIKQAEKIAGAGIKEIILTGVNIGDFGKTTNESFLDLLKNLSKVKNIKRYRISSIEPDLLTSEIIGFISQSEKFLPHFHIPLQSGCNDILDKMNRKYNRELFQDKVNQIRKKIPDAFIGVDVIVGFPGEDEKKFKITEQFLQETDASYYHVFPFSERPNARAAKMNHKVPGHIIKKRARILQSLAEKKQKKFYRRHLGENRPVLFEHYNKEGKMFGFTDNYIKVETNYNENLAETIKEVRLIDLNKHNNVEIQIKSQTNSNNQN